MPAATSTNLAAGKATSESSATPTSYPSSNVTDGDQNTYWESANNAFPQWVQVDLGSAQSVEPDRAEAARRRWGARNETIVGSGQHRRHELHHAVKAAATYTFDPATSNTVTITFTATTQRYLRLNITANTGWPAGQISGFQVWNF